MNLRDIQGEPCSCGQCVQAGVSDKPIRRDPHSGVFLHGYDLRRWYEARDGFLAKARKVVGTLAEREPGEDG
jgi:hypothetical protein